MHDTMLETVTEIDPESVLTCPKCGFEKSEVMPTDRCIFFYECTNCHEGTSKNVKC